MKYLGLDLGTKTLGLAVSDSNGIISMPYKTINYDNYDYLISELENIIKEEKIDEIILGLPKNMDNSLGKRAIETLEFQKLLENKLNIKVNMQDERLSTVESERFLISNNVSREKRKKIIDTIIKYYNLNFSTLLEYSKPLLKILIFFKFIILIGPAQINLN